MRNLLPAGLATLAALSLAACGGGGGEKAGSAAPARPNTAPRISGIADQTIPTDTTQTFEFTVSDAETDAGKLVVKAEWSDKRILPADRVTLGGSGEKRTLTVRPADDTGGTVQFDLVVVDAEGSSNGLKFTLTFKPVDRPFRDTVFAVFRMGLFEEPVPISGVRLVLEADEQPGVYDSLLPTPEEAAKPRPKTR